MSQQEQNEPSITRSALGGALAAYAAAQLSNVNGPVWVNALYGVCVFASGLAGLQVLAHGMRTWRQTKHFARALRGDQIKGQAAFMSRAEAKAAGLANWRGGMPLGLLDGLPVAAHTETHTLVNGPAGSGKTVSFFFPLLMHRENACLVMDPKGEGYEVAGPVRYGRMGRTVQNLDPLDPNSAQINPLDLIRRKLAGDNPEALTIARTYALQLHPEPEEEGQNKFFRIGARRIITALILIVAATFEEERATLTSAYRLLIDEDALNVALMGAATCTLLNGEIAAMAEELHREAFGDGI